MGDEFWEKIQATYDAERAQRKVKAQQIKREKAQKAEKERFQREADEYQQKCYQTYSSNFNSVGSTVNDGDAASLYEKYSQKNSVAYKYEIANRYGAHNDGYSSTGKIDVLSRGMGYNPHQGVKIADRTNNHRYDASAPKIKIRLQNTWTPQQQTQKETTPTQSSSFSNRTFNGGRSNGGSKLGGGAF